MRSHAGTQDGFLRLLQDLHQDHHPADHAVHPVRPDQNFLRLRSVCPEKLNHGTAIPQLFLLKNMTSRNVRLWRTFLLVMRYMAAMYFPQWYAASPASTALLFPVKDFSMPDLFLIEKII